MTREAIAAYIHWHEIVWGAGLLNPCMIVPQLVKIWRTRQTADISIWFLSVLVFLQSTFAVHGFFIRDPMVMWSNGGAALTTAAVISSVFYLQRR